MGVRWYRSATERMRKEVGDGGLGLRLEAPEKWSAFRLSAVEAEEDMVMVSVEERLKFDEQPRGCCIEG